MLDTNIISDLIRNPQGKAAKRIAKVGEDNICFETDYPHTDTTWPYSEAYIEKLCVGLTDEVAKARGRLEKKMGLSLGDSADPLLVSVRSGAKFSMPGMMDTVLNLGLNDQSVEGLAKQTGQYDVVLADQASYPAVPTWGGKLVAWNGALAFVPDIAQRRSQAAAFFDSAESLTERIALLHEYSVRWVIYDRQAATPSADFVASIAGWGTPFASSPDGTYVLVSVNP